MIQNIGKSLFRINEFIKKTPLELSLRLSEKYNCNIFHKQMYREPKFPFFTYLFDKKNLINYD